MSCKITVPKNLTASSIPSLMLNFEETNLYQDEDVDILFDLSSLEYADTEGINYIALLPFRLKSIFDKITIILPISENILAFFEYNNLLRLLFDNFTIHGGYRCVEDVMFFKNKRFSIKNGRKAKVSLIQPEMFENFLRYELPTLEKLIRQKQYSTYLVCCFYELSKNIFDHPVRQRL